MAPITRPDRCTCTEAVQCIKLLSSPKVVGRLAACSAMTIIFYDCLLKYSAMGGPFIFCTTALVGVILVIFFFMPTGIEIAELRRIQKEQPPGYDAAMKQD